MLFAHHCLPAAAGRVRPMADMQTNHLLEIEIVGTLKNENANTRKE
jgi:hypothetical protein